MGATEDAGDREIVTAEDLARRVRLSVDHGHLHALRLIDIQVSGDKVVLSGQVATFHQKQLATALARRVSGVFEVMNQLEVQDGNKDEKPRRPGGLRRSRLRGGVSQVRDGI